MIEFAIGWFGIGAFVAIVNFIQWILDGAMIGIEGEPEDRFYYLKGMLTNVIGGFVFGPVVLGIQWGTGMPILPTKRQ